MSNKTPDQLIAEIRALIVELTDITKAKMPPNSEPIIWGNGLSDVRSANGRIHIALSSDIGWVSAGFDPVWATRIASAIQVAVVETLASNTPNPAGVSGDQTSIH